MTAPRQTRQPTAKRTMRVTGKPNILIIMVDQLNGKFFPDGPADFLHAPHLKALAARSARFRNNYTSSPLCAPARASFMAGQLPSRTRVYDNAAEYASSIPTYAHHLRRAGYYTALSGKMHFVGPDQLHGFEERLTTDIYPADFGWTPDYRKPGERIDWWYHNLGSVTGGGIAEITNQMEYDDEVAFLANQKLYHLCARARRRGPPPLVPHRLLHPSARPLCRAPESSGISTRIASISARRSARLPKTSRTRIRSGSFIPATTGTSTSPTNIRAVRVAPISPTSPISTRRSANWSTRCRARACSTSTCIVFCSDHGDMLGERGLVVQDELLRGLGARAADDRRPGHRTRPAPCADLQSRRDADARSPRRHFA